MLKRVGYVRGWCRSYAARLKDVAGRKKGGPAPSPLLLPDDEDDQQEDDDMAALYGGRRLPTPREVIQAALSGGMPSPHAVAVAVSQSQGPLPPTSGAVASGARCLWGTFPVQTLLMPLLACPRADRGAPQARRRVEYPATSEPQQQAPPPPHGSRPKPSRDAQAFLQRAQAASDDSRHRDAPSESSAAAPSSPASPPQQARQPQRRQQQPRRFEPAPSSPRVRAGPGDLLFLNSQRSSQLHGKVGHSGGSGGGGGGSRYPARARVAASAASQAAAAPPSPARSSQASAPSASRSGAPAEAPAVPAAAPAAVRRSVRRSVNGLALRASSVVELLKAHSSVVGKAKKAADHLQELLVSSTREEQNRMRMLQSGDPAVLAANHGQEWDDGRTRYVTQLAALLDDHIAQLQVRVRLCWRPCGSPAMYSCSAG